MKTKKTLVAIRLRAGRARELGQLSIMLIVLGILLAGVAGAQYALCQRDHPGRPWLQCIRKIK